MASQADIAEQPRSKSGRRIGCYASLVMLAILAVVAAVLWWNRERIAEDVIADQLASYGIEATYKIESIGAGRQVFTDVVVGDPRRPDLTVERVEMTIRLRLGLPEIAELRLVRPRLHGKWVDGKLSFGALDPLLFPEKQAEPFELPDMTLAIEDGRGLLESDYGPVGIGVEGEGHLRGGFAGELAAIAPRLSAGGCEATRASLYGRVTVAGTRPRFAGPLRLARLDCREQGIALADAAVQIDAGADPTLAVFEGDAGLRTAAAAYGSNRAAALTGTSRFTWRDGGLTARYDLAGRDVATAQVAATRIALEGWLRTRRRFERIELDADVAGEGVRLGRGLDAALAGAAEAGDDTLIGPIAERARARLAAEGRASRLAGELTLRRTGERTSVVIPGASLRGTSGATLVSLSRFQLTTGGSAAPRLSGSFATGGEGLPRLTGRLEQRPDGAVQARLRMAEYAVGSSRLAVPELALVQQPNGAIGFAGEVRASGKLPGGQVEALAVPVAGNWSAARGLAVGNACTELRFERLQFAEFALARQGLTLCPPRGSALVRYDERGLRIVAGAASLQLAGRLGETPIAIRSGPVGLAYPGTLTARRVTVALGPRETASTFTIDDLNAQFGEGVAGRFAGTEARLYAVPLDLVGASGTWRYAGGRLTLGEGAFRLLDRQEDDRFNPLVAEGATLTLVDNRITAAALLREPSSGKAVSQVDLVHNLSTGVGHADLAVKGLTFDKTLQPADSGCTQLLGGEPVTEPLGLSCLAFGVVSNMRGTVTGTGRIDWNETAVTSSGRFTTEALDFAAAFGPVRGASGTIVFSDLLGLTTAPDQRLRVASVNPGIEVTDGEIGIELRGGEVLAMTGGTWPFMGGTLTMRPVEIRFGAAEERRYVLEIEGLDAARFIERMELQNISARGIFDGTVPLVFDENGNGRVEGGLLISRPPGGNISYIGELTYEDLGAMANMAFAALRSLDYRQANIAMDGELIGEIVTRVQFDGVRQGVGAERNIATRALARLPIRFNLNVRAQFYSLLGTLRTIYDPAFIPDPRAVGLLDEAGNVIRRASDQPVPEPLKPEDLTPDEATIQRRESEETP